jgi:hypothetical protein
MDNVMKLVILGAGVLLTIGVVAAGYLIFQGGQDMTKGASQQMTNLQNQISNSDVAAVEGNAKVDGSTVIGYAKTKASKDLTITVNGASYGGEGAKVYNVTDTSDANYISPLKTFSCKVVRNDKTGLVSEIQFTQN